MHILKAAAIAFSMYSKIPMPQFEWREKDLKYMLCFFPLVGAAVGVCEFFWIWFCDGLGVNLILRTAVFCVIPILITGGIHLDGFMDVMDAHSSHKSREEKLLILKDPHIGAVAVIMLVVLAAVYFGAFSQISDVGAVYTVLAGFILSRSLSGFGAVTFKKAKKDGTLFMFSDAAGGFRVRLIMLFEAIVCSAFMILISPIYGAAAAAAAFLVLWYYYLRMNREFGGITGDTAGYFLCVCECVIATVVCALQILMG